MNFFKFSTRRLEQGVLETLGAATSSRDASFELDSQRCKRLEDSLTRIHGAATVFLASLRKNVEDAREVAATVDYFAAVDVKHGVRARTSDTVRFVDGLQASLRVHTGIKAAVLTAVEAVVTGRVVKPASVLLKQLPALRRLIEQRRDALTGE